MAFPTIPTVAAGRVLTTNQADTSGTRTFPNLSSLTKNSGDLLIAIIVVYQSSTVPCFSSWGGGFTEFTDQGSATTLSIGAAYKVSTGSETGTFTVTQAATITGHASMILLSIPGAHGSTVPEAGTIANGTSAIADPGSFNPANWDVEDTLWISVVASGMTSGTGSWTGCGASAPTNYTDWADSNTTDSSTVGQTELAVSFRQNAAATQDVGTASGVDTSNARNSALVIAVRPAVVKALAFDMPLGLVVDTAAARETFAAFVAPLGPTIDTAAIRESFVGFDMPLGFDVATALGREAPITFDYPLGLQIDTNLTAGAGEQLIAFDMPLGLTVDTGLGRETFAAFTDDLGLQTDTQATRETFAAFVDELGLGIETALGREAPIGFQSDLGLLVESALGRETFAAWDYPLGLQIDTNLVRIAPGYSASTHSGPLADLRWVA